MVKKSDGTIELFDDAELTELKRAGKIKIERATTMGGKFTGLIMLLVD